MDVNKEIFDGLVEMVELEFRKVGPEIASNSDQDKRRRDIITRWLIDPDEEQQPWLKIKSKRELTRLKIIYTAVDKYWDHPDRGRLAWLKYVVGKAKPVKD